MFNRIEYHAGDTKIEVKGVNAPEAARFLHDIEKESSARIDKVIFDRLDCPEFPLEWACVVQHEHVTDCLHVVIYYNYGRGREKITLPVIKKERGRVTERNNVLREIAKDMAASIAGELVRIFSKPGFPATPPNTQTGKGEG